MTTRSGPSVLEIAGIGFGPSNMALAIALEEIHGAGVNSRGPTMEFFERQPAFGWHRGMLMEGATMQVSFLKDLATMRDPGSRYTFTAYLKAKGRLAKFINSKTLFPFRVEFHDYLEWAASHFAPVVSYGSDVLGIRPVVEDGVMEYLDVIVRTFPDGSDPIVRRARNVVIGTGLAPWLPDGVKESARVWHSSRLMDRATALTGAPRGFVVIGAGQSAAEAAEYLHHTFSGAQVNAVFARYGYSVADDSPFTNSIFDPEAVDEFYGASQEVKQDLLDYHANTNYSVVDLSLTEELYRRTYQESVLGRQRLRIHRVSRVRAVEEHPDGVRVTVEHLPDRSVEVLDVDAVVYATGYRPSDPAPLLQDLLPECKLDDAGRLALDRDYRIVTAGDVRCGVYLHGGSAERTHGLSAGLLSNTAVRSGEIADSIVKR
ncbi:lysine N(6)-hydroxylase/L-ornithine N(5)-oxygenase family protein [Streptomyces sp. NPDC102274]|uniref:lysine N(6)-hydroxylase/L-ornithine N(5)-oxygenase family protein n=1 Tax=Streptomyces sp. NPDC102274 TaxID=3366151 RepID=UPI00381A06DD